MDKVVFDRLSSFNLNHQQKRDLIDVIKYVSKDDDFEDTFILNIVQNENDELIVKQEDVPDLVKALLDKKQIVGKAIFDHYTTIDLISVNQFIFKTPINTYIFSVYFNTAVMVGSSPQYMIVSGEMSTDQIDVNVDYGDFLTPEDVDSKFKQLENNINSLKKVATTEANGLMSKEDKVKLDTKVATKEDITEEQTAREEADKILTNKLTTEVGKLTNADTKLSDQINAEQIARTNADKVLTTNLAKEITDRTNAVNAEATARVQADTAINGEIQGIKDKGSLFDLFKAAGATLNADGTTWSMNGITDLTTQELINAYQRRPIGPYLVEVYSNVQPHKKFRTNFPIPSWYNPIISSADRLCYANPLIEVLQIGGTNTITGSYVILGSCSDWLNGAKKLRIILGPNFVVNSITFAKNDFRGCQALTDIRLTGLKSNIYFQDSPALNKGCIEFMIKKASPSSPITITLHPTAYAMASVDPEIQAELEKQPNISLAEGEPTA